MKMAKKIIFLFLFLVLLLFGINGFLSNPFQDLQKEDFKDWNSLVVTATAYNSHHSQGSGDASITAWGDTLHPGAKSIAVSRDLILNGLSYKTPVKIEGLEGLYIVNDKMHARWRNKIDVYMGDDTQKAIEWGRRKVEICFPATPE